MIIRGYNYSLSHGRTEFFVRSPSESGQPPSAYSAPYTRPNPTSSLYTVNNKFYTQFIINLVHVLFSSLLFGDGLVMLRTMGRDGVRIHVC